MNISTSDVDTMQRVVNSASELAEQINNLHESESFSKSIAALRASASLLRTHPNTLAETIKSLPPDKQEIVFLGLALWQTSTEAITTIINAQSSDTHAAETRNALEYEPQKISRDRTIILKKESAVQYDMRNQGIKSFEELREWYEQQGRTNIDNLFERHQAHCDALEKLETCLGHNKSYHLYEFNDDSEVLELIEKEDPQLIAIIGGDDTIKASSHLVGDRFVWLLNSDETGSIGAHCSHTVSQFEEQLQHLEQGTFLIEEWPLLVADIKYPDTGKVITTIPAIDEIEIGDYETKWPFRGVISQAGKKSVNLKGNGVIFATPAGYTGWYLSETRDVYPLGHNAPNTNKEFELFQRGAYRFGKTKVEHLVQDPSEVQVSPGQFKPEDPYPQLRSTTCHQARVNIDCVREYDLPRDAVVTIRLSENTIKVISKEVQN